MDEQNPVREYLRGCGVGFLIALAGAFALGLGALFCLGFALSPGVTPIGRGIGLILGGALVLLGFYMGYIFVRKIVDAFSAKQSYHAMGLLTFFVIPLLFFGACTMANVF